MGKTDKQSGIVARNRKARRNFELIEKVEAGLVLLGTEVKSLRQGKCSIEERYVQVFEDHAEVVGMHIPKYRHGNINNHEPLRKRRLLLHRRQLRKIRQKVREKGLTVVPLAVYFSGGHAKLEIALARGKKLYDKRVALKRREQQRDIKRAMKRN